MKKTLVLLMSVLLAIACWGIAPTSASAETPQGFKAEMLNDRKKARKKTSNLIN